MGDFLMIIKLAEAKWRGIAKGILSKDAISKSERKFLSIVANKEPLSSTPFIEKAEDAVLKRNKGSLSLNPEDKKIYRHLEKLRTKIDPTVHNDDNITQYFKQKENRLKFTGDKRTLSDKILQRYIESV
jgi:hypothetical protein